MLSNRNFKYLWRNGVFPRISSSVMCCGRHKHQNFLTRFQVNRINSIFQEVDFYHLGEAISLCCFAVIQNYIFDSHEQCLWKTFANVHKNIWLAWNCWFYAGFRAFIIQLTAWFRDRFLRDIFCWLTMGNLRLFCSSLGRVFRRFTQDLMGNFRYTHVL